MQSTTGGSFTNAYTSANQYLTLINGLSLTYPNLTSACPKITLWGCKNISGGAGSMLFQYSGENYAVGNPGITGTLKTWGYVNPTSGYPTGITLTLSGLTNGGATTGAITIVVKGTY
jgi:hypothetical protein